MPKPKKTPFRLLSTLAFVPLILIFVFSLVGLITSTPDFIQGYQIRNHDKTVEGTVLQKTSNSVRYSRVTRDSEKAYDTANVAYTVNGQTYTEKHAVYTPKVGEHITLFYDPSNPQHAVTEIEVQFAKNYWIPVALISGLGIILIPALLYMKFSRRKK